MSLWPLFFSFSSFGREGGRTVPILAADTVVADLRVREKKRRSSLGVCILRKLAAATHIR